MTVDNMQSSYGNANYTFASKILPEEDPYLRLLQKKAKSAEQPEEFNDDNIPTQTGSRVYTGKQWRNFLEEYDAVAEYAREMMRERHEKQYEQQLEREEKARQAVMDDYIEAVHEAKRKRAEERKEFIFEEEWKKEKYV